LEKNENSPPDEPAAAEKPADSPKPARESAPVRKRPATRPPKSVGLDFADLLDDSIAPDPSPAPIVSPKVTPISTVRQSPLEIFESSLMMRLEKELFDLRGLFVADFQKLMDDTFAFERITGAWLSEFTSELKDLLKEQPSVRPFIYDDSSIVSQLAGIQTLLPKMPTAKLEPLTESPFTGSLLERPRALLAELVNERTQLDQIRADNEEAERAHQQSYILGLNLEARNLEIDIEKDTIAKHVTKFRTDQTEEFERSFDVIQNSQESERSTLRNSLESLIDQLRNLGPRRASVKLLDFRHTTGNQISDLNLANNQLWIKVERFARSVQLFDGHSQLPAAPSVSFQLDEPPCDGTLAEVEEKLAAIQRRRAQVMRDVARLCAELSTE
jgi:hypothetical protein